MAAQSLKIEGRVAETATATKCFAIASAPGPQLLRGSMCPSTSVPRHSAEWRGTAWGQCDSSY
jgi:hypothetical protein